MWGTGKNRYIRDNFFVLNVVLNYIKRSTEDPVDLGAYDVQKCFVTIWAQEALNDAYDLGFQNDKLPLVHLANQSAHIAENLQLEHQKEKPYTIQSFRGLFVLGCFARPQWTSLVKLCMKTQKLPIGS